MALQTQLIEPSLINDKISCAKDFRSDLFPFSDVRRELVFLQEQRDEESRVIVAKAARVQSKAAKAALLNQTYQTLNKHSVIIKNYCNVFKSMCFEQENCKNVFFL